MTPREKEELQARHAIMRDTVAEQSAELAKLRADLAAARAEVERAMVLLHRVRIGGLSRDLTSNRDLAKDIRAYLDERDIPPQGRG